MHVYAVAASECASMDFCNLKNRLLMVWLKAIEVNGTYPFELVVTGAINAVAERCCSTVCFGPLSTLILLRCWV